jgi:flagellar protein FlaJ
MIDRLAFRLFGGLAGSYKEYFQGLDENLKRGMIRIPLQEYLSRIFFVSFIAFAVSLVLGSVFITIMVAVYSGAAFFGYTLSIIVSALAGGTVFFIGYYYPTIKAKNMKTQIDRGLPFAVFYMATTASSGINPIEIFKSLSEKGGAISIEASKVYNNVKSLGMNLTDAMSHVAARTPSPSFADLLWGMVSVITTGGDLEDYLNRKTRSFMNVYRRSLNDYAKQVALYTEIYITLVMVGSLFFIVLTAIMSPLGGFSILLLQTFMVFIVIPLVSLAFIVLVKGLSPSEG